MLEMIQFDFMGQYNYNIIINRMLKQIARMTEEETLDNSPPHPFVHSFQSQQKRLSLSTQCYRNKHKYRNIHAMNDTSIFSISATTLTRGNAPAYKLSKQQRFKDTTQQRNNKIRFLNLSLERNLDRGISFTRSKRKDHFLNRQKITHPSSASYFDNFQDSQCNIGDINPQLAEKLHIITSNNTPDQRFRMSGPTIKKFEKTHKLYQYHSKNLIYQPQLTQNNLGIGSYDVGAESIRRKSPAYSMRLVLTRFNEDKKNLPCPGAYQIRNINPHKTSSINEKGTFQQSKRIFLSKPCNMVPGPGAYFSEN